eukprot:COSAG06_NODE_54979_length_292_cov_0.512953_1_plen_45_part_01
MVKDQPQPHVAGAKEPDRRWVSGPVAVTGPLRAVPRQTDRQTDRQ